MEKGTQYRTLLIQAIHACATKFADVAERCVLLSSVLPLPWFCMCSLEPVPRDNRQRQPARLCIDKHGAGRVITTIERVVPVASMTGVILRSSSCMLRATRGKMLSICRFEGMLCTAGTKNLTIYPRWNRSGCFPPCASGCPITPLCFISLFLCSPPGRSAHNT